MEQNALDRVAGLAVAARQELTTREYALEWLRARARQLEGRTPLEAAAERPEWAAPAHELLEAS